MVIPEPKGEASKIIVTIMNAPMAEANRSRADSENTSRFRLGRFTAMSSRLSPNSFYVSADLCVGAVEDADLRSLIVGQFVIFDSRTRFAVDGNAVPGISRNLVGRK